MSIHSPEPICKVFVLPNGKVPVRAHSNDAGFDACLDLTGHPDAVNGLIALMPHHTYKISLGFHMEPPADCWFHLDVRSSVGLKGVTNLCSTIDASYRGLWHIVLHNLSKEVVTFKHGERVCQLMSMPFSEKLIMVPVGELEQLAPSARGTGGFGSSGKF